MNQKFYRFRKNVKECHYEVIKLFGDFIDDPYTTAENYYHENVASNNAPEQSSQLRTNSKSPQQKHIHHVS